MSYKTAVSGCLCTYEGLTVPEEVVVDKEAPDCV